MPTKETLAGEAAEIRKSVGDLAIKWRTLAYQVQADMKGSVNGAKFFRPSGIVKQKMGTQVSVLLSCASSLEDLLKIE